MTPRLPRTLLALWLCASGVFSSAAWQPATAQQKDTIRLRITPYLGYAPFYIAKAEGYFSDSGLDVEFADTITAAEAVPALARGDVDALSGAISPGLLNAIARGARIRFVSSQTSLTPGPCSYMAILSTPALVASGALNDVSKMRRVRVGSGGSFAATYLFEKTIAPLGLSPGDFESVAVPETISGDLLRQGRLELAIAGEPWLSRAVFSGAGVIWKKFEDVSPGFEFSAMLFGPRLLDNRELGVRLMTAYLRGVRRYNEGKTPRNVQILAQATHLDADELRRACWPFVRGDATLNGARLLEFQGWMVGARLLDRPLALDQFLDPSFVDRANRALSASNR